MKAVIHLLKSIFKRDKDDNVTLLLYDEEIPGESESIGLKPRGVLTFFYILLFTVVLLIVLLIGFTPVGNLIVTEPNEKLRSEIIKITEKMEAMQDSLEARENQIGQIKEVLSENKDTTFNISNDFREEERMYGERYSKKYQPSNRKSLLSPRQIIFSHRMNNAPEFPAPYPMEGSLTQRFNRENGHYGIDIAARSGSAFKVIADGVVIHASWTINYGYVLRVQHGNGYISVYKHCKNLLKEEGDIVVEGEVLGEIADTGVLSSGPHLHFEVWKDGIPVNPEQFLIKI